MVTLSNTGVYVLNGKEIINDDSNAGNFLSQRNLTKEQAIQNTVTYNIFTKHNTSDNTKQLKLKFDALTSHDITYVGVIQSAKASGLEAFPVPYVLTNCHNSLCAVGGTINEDDHVFGLSAAKRFGGVFVPAHQAVIHQYMREMMAGCGKMILGTDSHTRYGALGTCAIGEGGGELAKQVLGKTYDLPYPEVVGVMLTGKPQKGVGPMDVALAIISAVFKCGYVKNKVMEFFGDGIKNLSVDFRNGIDVMTTETTCLSSIWETDEQVATYFNIHGRPGDYKKLSIGEVVYYDGLIQVDMDKIRPMIAMPFHPANVYLIDDLIKNPKDILAHVEKEASSQMENAELKLSDKLVDGKLLVSQGVVCGCAGGTFENICDVADILKDSSVGNGAFGLSVYPSSQPTYYSLVENGTIARLMNVGATIRSAICGPCFGAGDVPANNGLSIRHVTRNFPSREGSVPGKGQIASVALMDARSIAATARNQGFLTSAYNIDTEFTRPTFAFNSNIYDSRVYNGVGKPQPETQLVLGPNIKDWPTIPALSQHLLLKVVSVITDPVTTTDELIPSGETSSYRSNPLGLAEFTLSRKDPNYVPRAKEVHALEKARLAGENPFDAEILSKLDKIGYSVTPENTGIGSVIYANKPGDGSAREQAASCQRVLGGCANIAVEYATKRYRSNLINWGMLPFVISEELPFGLEDYIFIPNIRDAVANATQEIEAFVVSDNSKSFKLSISSMTNDEREIILAGCLINYYRS